MLPFDDVTSSCGRDRGHRRPGRTTTGETAERATAEPGRACAGMIEHDAWPRSPRVTGGRLHRADRRPSGSPAGRVRLAAGRPGRAVPGPARRAGRRARLRRRRGRGRCRRGAAAVRSTPRGDRAPCDRAAWRRAATWPRPTRRLGAAVLAALARSPRTTLAGCRGLTVVGVTGSSGKTSTKDLLAAVLAPLGPTVAPPGSFNNELGLPVDGAARRRRHPPPGAGALRPRASGTSPRCAGSRRRGSAWCSTSGARTWASSARRRRSRRPRASWSRRCRPTGVAVLNADDPAVAAMADAHRGPGRDRRPAAGRATCGPSDVTLDGAAAPRFRLVAPAGLGGRWRCGWSARTTSATPWPRRRSRSSCGADAGRRSPRRCRRPAPALALADGGHRPRRTASPWSTTPTTRTRSRCARRCRRWRRSAATAGSAAHLGRCSGRMARAGRRRPRAAHAEVGRRSAADAGRCDAARSTRRRPRVRARRVPVAGRRGGARAAARGAGARRRRAGQGFARPVGLDRLARDAARCRTRGARRVRGVFIAAGVGARGLDPAHPVPDPVLRAAGLRPGDPRRGPAEPQGQARHARPWAASRS